MPKDIESLEQSRKIRKAVIEKYGEVPSSVWNIDYSWGKHIKEMDEIKQDNVALDKHKKMDYGEKKTITTLGGEEINVLDKSKLRKAFKMSSVNVRGKGSGVSTFPPDLARRIVLYYSKENDTVLDCFSGHNSRLQVTYELNRNYIGYDICSSYMRFNEKVRDEITGKGTQKLLFAPKNFITLREKSSEKLDEEDNSVDMIYSSPPYHNIEYYDDHPQQLGYNKTYEEFLEGLLRVIKESYRVLKPNKYCIFNVNDFRKDGKLYTFHCDTIDLFKKAGFRIWDIIIIKWQMSVGNCFASQVEERKITSKMHEYLIVGKKII